MGSISASCRKQMFELMIRYFDNVDMDTFGKDLVEKEWVIVLRDAASGRIKGFSTQMLLENTIDEIPVRAIYSGDTIIEREFWGETELVKVWFDLVFSIKRRCEEIKLYWLLVVMGYKTYRFMPVFFRDFFPRHNKPTPGYEQRVLDTFSRQKFPAEYEASTGLVLHSDDRERLKPGVAEITENRLRNPHVRFFAKRNPSYTTGDGLVCLTEISRENLTRAARKVITRGESPV